jgi:competence protein ComEA
MDWIRLKAAELLGANQPLNKKLLLLVGSIVALVVFAINGMTSSQTQKLEALPSLAADEVVVKSATIFVHLVGEVIKPGIYQLESGSRVMDAVFAAGGFTKSADDASVNLAREITDGEQIVIFKQGLAPQIVGGNSGSASQISLNRASQAELEDLPGVGPALAQRIIDWRDANGGFKKKEDLLSISGIGDKLFAGIKDQVTL